MLYDHCQVSQSFQNKIGQLGTVGKAEREKTRLPSQPLDFYSVFTE